MTDNRTLRTVADVRHALTKHGGNLDIGKQYLYVRSCRSVLFRSRY